MDSLGKVYVCHLKPWIVGDLTKQNFNDLDFIKYDKQVHNCNDCWMVCSTRSSIKKYFIEVLKDIFYAKLTSQFM